MEVKTVSLKKYILKCVDCSGDATTLTLKVNVLHFHFASHFFKLHYSKVNDMQVMHNNGNMLATKAIKIIFRCRNLFVTDFIQLVLC